MDLEKMKKVRKQKKITYKELSARSGLPERTIYGIFMGETLTPRIDTVEAIERALGIEPDSVTVINELTENEERLLSAFRSLIPPMQDYIIEMVEKLVKQAESVKIGG